MPFLFWMVVILVAAKFGGEVFERWGQPAVLGELVAGRETPHRAESGALGTP